MDKENIEKVLQAALVDNHDRIVWLLLEGRGMNAHCER